MHFRGESMANGGEENVVLCAGWSYFQLIFLLMLTWTPMKSFFRKLRMNIHDAWLNGWALSINCVGLCSKLMDTQHLFYCPLIWVLWELGFGKTCDNACVTSLMNGPRQYKASHTNTRVRICFQLGEMFQSQPSTTVSTNHPTADACQRQKSQRDAAWS